MPDTQSTMSLKAFVATPRPASTNGPPSGNRSVIQPLARSQIARNGASGSNQPAPPSAEAGNPPIWDSGSTGRPPVQVSKCKCGPVELPVLPDRAIAAPLATVSPTLANKRDKCP